MVVGLVQKGCLGSPVTTVTLSLDSLATSTLCSNNAYISLCCIDRMLMTRLSHRSDQFAIFHAQVTRHVENRLTRIDHSSANRFSLRRLAGDKAGQPGCWLC